MTELKKNTTQACEPVWFICEVCEDWYCSIHEEHVAECNCPSLEEWLVYDPRNGELLFPENK